MKKNKQNTVAQKKKRIFLYRKHERALKKTQKYFKVPIETRREKRKHVFHIGDQVEFDIQQQQQQ